jgi:hypothetical protein
VSSSYASVPFQEALRAFDARLQRRWAAQEGGAPEGLRAYRAAWLQHFAHPGETCTQAEMLGKCAQAAPLLVSDFHPLARSGRMLARILREVPWAKPPRVVLELLPASVAVPAAELGSDPEIRLVDGRLLREALPELYEAILACHADLHGAWVAGTPSERDEAAAGDWLTRQNTREARPEILFFGDWHLAPPHLPAALSRRGAQPVCVHQSPAPLWSRTLTQDGESILRLGSNHYAWMHTPPLAFWTTSRQEVDAGTDPEEAEASAGLIEELAQGICEILDLPAPVEALTVLGPRAWPGFWRSLPLQQRQVLQEHAAPLVPVLHPHEATLFAPRQPSWNQLVDAAAACVAQQSALSKPANTAAWITFRRLWARAWNPFLPTRSRHELRQELGIASGVGGLRAAEAASGYLDQLVLGERVAEALHRHPLLDRAALRTLLREGRHAFIWHHGVSTIQASPLSA